VWCKLIGCMFFGFLLGSILMSLCISHKIHVSKFWGGGCRELLICVSLFWENWFHSHCSRSVVMVAMCFPL
jgi:hypothetical protein